MQPVATPVHYDWLAVSTHCTCSEARPYCTCYEALIHSRFRARQEGQVSSVSDTVTPFELPPIDAGPLRGGFLHGLLVSSKDKKLAADALVSSLKQHGFAVIVNHGLEASTTEMIERTRELFDLPSRIKGALAQVWRCGCATP